MAFPGFEIVVEDLSMVKGERPRPVAGIDDDRRPGVVGAARPARGPGEEDRRDRVETRVARRIGIRAELADELDVEGGLLTGLPDRGRLEGFAVIDEAAGQGPAGGRILALDEDDAAAFPAVHDLDDDVDRGERVPELAAGHRWSQPSAAIVGAAGRDCQFCPHFPFDSPRMGTVLGGRDGFSGRSVGTKDANITDVNRPRRGERS